MTTKKGILSNPLVQFLVGTGIGALGGYLADRAYSTSSKEEKKKWDDNRLMHHGGFGCYAALAGAAAGNPFIAGVGTGLALTDLKDADEWFDNRRRKREL